MLGTGKTPTDAIESIESSGCEIVTVRRLPTDLKK
jgi:hypothetical protein